MINKSLKTENNFEPAGGGNSGTLNYASTYGTPSGGNITQNPSKFSSNVKSVNHFNNQDSGSLLSQEPISGDNLKPQVNQLFKKKITPSPDEILHGLQVELGNMVKKDKHIAKQIVLKNLKKDPNYYSRLQHLNINDDKMTVDESNKTMTIQEQFQKQDKNLAATKNVLDQMIADRQQSGPKREVKPEIMDIMKEMWANKREKLYGRREENNNNK
jgi:hypothetical protein